MTLKTNVCSNEYNITSIILGDFLISLEYAEDAITFDMVNSNTNRFGQPLSLSEYSVANDSTQSCVHQNSEVVVV